MTKDQLTKTQHWCATWTDRPVHSNEELAEERKACADNLGLRKSLKGFNVGDIVTPREAYERHAYYHEHEGEFNKESRTYTDKDGRRLTALPGDSLVIGSIGGPRDFCCDAYVDGVVLRFSFFANELTRIK